MQEIDEHLLQLLHRQIAGQELEPEEQQALDKWLAASPRHPALLAMLADEAGLEKDLKELLRIDEDAVLKKMQEQIAREKKKVFAPLPFLRYAAAAAILALVAMAAWLLWPAIGHHPLPGQAGTEEPGGNKALLRLEDGRTITLDNTPAGVLTHEGGATIQKTDSSRLEYAITAAPGAPCYNQLITPAKGQYRIKLSDGTQVWLNASSSLRYPTVFTGPERLVELRGEAFFEVAAHHDKAGRYLPLQVAVMDSAGARAEVQVLGTRFNINAYADEPGISTALLDGAIRLKAGDSLRLLRPGQQASLDRSGRLTLSTPNMSGVTAWTEGRFIFRDTDIATIMRMISRWYGVRVIYEGTVTQTFTGEYLRSSRLSQLLGYLENTGDVHFRVQGGTVWVKG